MLLLLIKYQNVKGGIGGGGMGSISTQCLGKTEARWMTASL